MQKDREAAHNPYREMYTNLGGQIFWLEPYKNSSPNNPKTDPLQGEKRGWEYLTREKKNELKKKI